MMHKERAYIGLGSNLGEATKYIEAAFLDINEIEHTRLLSTASLYQSAPMGPQDQPDYVNSVCLIETGLKADTLLKELQRIEDKHGRKRTNERWGPRTLDLDILLFGTHEIESDILTIPHYGIADREFVLVPLFEIAPNMVMPDGKPISQWVAKCSLDGLKRLRPSNEL